MSRIFFVVDALTPGGGLWPSPPENGWSSMAKRPGAQTIPRYRNRVVELRYLKPGDIADHPHQWRMHPETQKAAIEGVLREIGIAGVLLVYESAENGGQTTAIDGHLRKSLDPDQPWPCVVLDVDDAESAYLLTTHDPLAALAEANREKLSVLLQQVQSGESAVQQMLSKLAAQTGLFPEPGGSPSYDEQTHATLVEQFLVPPFSILDARQGYWQARKAAWIAMGIQSELGRGGGLTMHAKQVTTEGLNFYRHRA